MAKIIRFPLIMADKAEVRDLEELREHFDLETVVSYYKSGKLLTWLKSRYFEDEAAAVEALDEDAADFQRQLCGIFGIEFAGDEVDLEEIELRQERLKKLREFTDEKEFIDHIDQVAFNQEELADLLDEDGAPIYLCGKRFTVPTSVKNKHYIGINDPEIAVTAKKEVDFEQSGITFTGTHFCDSYMKLLEATAETEKLDTSTKKIVQRHQVQVKPYRLYSNLLLDYEVDSDGRRYKEVNALYISDLSGENERLLYAPTAKLISKQFHIYSAYICGEDVYFTAHIEDTSTRFLNDPEDAVLAGGCVLKYNIAKAMPSLICNNLNIPSSNQIFATPNETVIISYAESVGSTRVFGVTMRVLVAMSSLLSNINQDYILVSRKQTQYLKGPDSLPNSFTECYLAHNYDKSQSVNLPHGTWIGRTASFAYFLVRSEVPDATYMCKQALYEFPIYENADFHMCQWEFCSNYSNAAKSVFISEDLLLYFEFDKTSNTISLIQKTHLSDDPVILLQDSSSNYSNSYVSENQIFTVKDGKVYCKYNGQSNPTYICDLPKADAGSVQTNSL